MEIGKNKTAKLGKDIDNKVSEKLIQDTYVDDGATGGSEEEVQRMVGKMDENGNYDGTLSKILALGGFKVKQFIIEGDMHQKEKNLLNNKVFGYGWNAKTGQMSLNFPINLSKKKKKIRPEPNLQVKDLPSLKSKTMNKRNLLGVTNSFGDFLGIGEPFTLRFKLLMKNLFDKKEPLMWDQEIDELDKQPWLELLSEAVLGEMIVFPRRSRPSNSVGGPRVAGFGDGALTAFGGCVYLVWEYKCGEPATCQECKGVGNHFVAY